MATGKKKARQRANRQNRGKPGAGVNSRERKRTAVNSREGKRAEFTGDRTSRTVLWAGLSVAVIVAVAIAVIVGVSGKKGGPAPAAAPVSAGNVTIPVAEVNDGTTHFYSSDVNGTAVKYFVMKATNGNLRAAFDACEVCYQYKKGYHQQGDAVQCNNCGRVFASNQISVERGGCNPGPIDAKVSGGKLVITPAQLQDGVRFF